MKCPNCGASTDGKFCEYCGTKLEQENQTIIINNYYGTNEPPAENMSSQYYPPYAVVSGKNRTVSLVLCFLLGFWGVHYFYVGRIGMGILYIFTCGLFGIGWIVDIIRIIAGAFSDVDGYPVKEW